MKPKRFFNLSIAILFVVVSTLASFGQPAAMTQQQRALADYIKKNYTKREAMIPMRDGVKLFVCIYEPKDKKQKYPIMFDRTPYSVGPYGPDAYKGSLGPDDLFPREGYIFVYGDVRGRYMSEGVYEDVRPYIPNKKGNQIDETTDTYDTVDWLSEFMAFLIRASTLRWPASMAIRRSRRFRHRRRCLTGFTATTITTTVRCFWRRIFRSSPDSGSRGPRRFQTIVM